MPVPPSCRCCRQHLGFNERDAESPGNHCPKDPLGLRPIWHTFERRVRAHIFVTALAFVLERMLERALRDARVSLSSTTAWSALETIRYVQFRVDGGAA